MVLFSCMSVMNHDILFWVLYYTVWIKVMNFAVCTFWVLGCTWTFWENVNLSSTIKNALYLGKCQPFGVWTKDKEYNLTLSLIHVRTVTYFEQREKQSKQGWDGFVFWSGLK
ncbi:hypothetical protein QVD17_30949 [Tagetes erecta]|uniref:Uncharacterized protein n=1 Tax=Tagetes erecta TaxID=13708 RepID=A0AAD8K2S9_TARER|nr:hypothetical protein QVD17_30949 [Tagetes erecta]